MNIPKIARFGSGLFLALGATALAAQGHCPMMGGGHDMGPGSMMGTGIGQPGCGYGMVSKGHLNLTDSQRTQIDAITKHHQASLTDKLKTADQARDAMRRAMNDPATKDGEIQALQTRMVESMTAVILERRAIRRECEAVLTPEQRKAAENGRSDLAGCPGPGFGRRGMGAGHGAMDQDGI